MLLVFSAFVNGPPVKCCHLSVRREICPGVYFYLGEGARSLPDHPDNPQRDADHGRRGHEPANAIAPVWVCVHVVVLQRLVFNQKEEENSLPQTKIDIKAVTFIYNVEKNVIRGTCFKIST